MSRTPNPKLDEIIPLYEKGLSAAEIGAFLGKSRQAVWESLKRRGVKLRTKIRHGSDNQFYKGKSLADKRAIHLVEKAVKKGILVPKPCEVCGKFTEFKDGRIGVEAHHDDYNKPLEVRWLCKKHHYEWHENNEAIPRKK